MAKILIIDDDSLVVATIRSVLKRSHEVSTASSGREALALLQTVDFDLALCDMIMPDMEGLETITHVKRLKPNIPIIAMSGGGRTKTMDFLRLAETMGAVDSLRKPFSGEEIIKVISKHLPPPDKARTATHAAV